ncbi:MAG: acylphosphatase [Patescibacteria group bacterium]|jgi:acylphosphatase
MAKRVTLKIHGLVQGVGYRYVGRNEAKKRRFTGYVRNLEGGIVEIVAEGEEKDLKDFIQWCYNGVGPAMVQKIEQSWSEATSEFSDFEIK